MFLGHNDHIAFMRQKSLMQAIKFPQQALYAIAHNSLAHLARNGHAHTQAGPMFTGPDKNEEMLGMVTPALRVAERIVRMAAETALLRQ